MQRTKISLSTSSIINVYQFKATLPFMVKHRKTPLKEQNNIDFRALLVINKAENVKCVRRVALEEK